MYTSAITQTESGNYRLCVYDDKTMNVIYKKEKPSYEQARKESLNFLYIGPNVAGGGSGDGSGNGRRRKPKSYVVKDDSQM